MRRTALIIGISVVVLLSAGIAALFLWPEAVHEPDPTPTPPSTDDTHGDLVRESIIDISSVHFMPNGSDEFTLVQDLETGGLELETADKIFPGAPAIMHSLFSRSATLTFLVRVTNNADDTQLAMFGFNEPASTVRLNRTDGTSLEFIIGDMQAAGTRRYVRLQDSREVFLLNEMQSSVLTLELEDVYDISFIPVDEFESEEAVLYFLEHVILEREDDTIELRKRFEEEFLEGDLPMGSSTYQILQPVVAESNDTVVQSVILENIISIYPTIIEEIRPADLSKYGLDDPVRLTVTIFEWTETLLIGNRDAERDGRFVMLEGHDAVLLDTYGDYSFLNVLFSQIRSSLIWLYNIDTVSTVVFDIEGVTRTLRFEHLEENDLRAWLDDKEISAQNARRLYMSALMISQSGSSTDPIPATDPVYTITINFIQGGSDKIDLYRLNESQFLIVHKGVNTEFYIIRLTLQQNLLSKFEVLDAGNDLPAS